MKEETMYKLVAIDLDGTMLNQYGIVSQNTNEAIQKAQEAGMEVIIASGRPIDSIKTIAKEIKSEKYFISGNGAIIYDMAKNEIIYEKKIKKFHPHRTKFTVRLIQVLWPQLPVEDCLKR